MAFRLESKASLVGFSADGKKLATMDEFDGIGNRAWIRIWDIKKGVQSCEVGLGCDSIRDILFSPDSRRLAATDEDEGLRIWSAETGQELGNRERKSKHPLGPFFSFTPDGEFIAYLEFADESPDKEFVVFLDAVTLQARGAIECSSIDRLAFSPDSSLAATYKKDDRTGTFTVVLWKIADGIEFGRVLAKHSLGGKALVFSPDLSKFAVAVLAEADPCQSKIELYDSWTGALLHSTSYSYHNKIGSLSFSPSGRFVIGHSLGHWDLLYLGHNPETRHTIWDSNCGLKKLGYFVETPQFSRQEDQVIIPTNAGAEVWAVQTMQKSVDLWKAGDDKRYHPNGFDGEARVSPNGKLAAVSHLLVHNQQPIWQRWIYDHVLHKQVNIPDEVTRVWSISSGRELATLPNCSDFQFSPNGDCLEVLSNLVDAQLL